MRKEPSTRRARLILSAVQAAGKLKFEDDFCEIEGEVRRLDQLLWYERQLAVYEFQFKQEYIFNNKTNRVAAYNCLRTRIENVTSEGCEIADLSPLELLLYTAMLVSLNSFVSAGYLFIPMCDFEEGDALVDGLLREFKIRFKKLDSFDGQSDVLLRTETLEDAIGLLNLLRHRLDEIPCTVDHIYPETPKASVTKELCFDSAHFITDHPGECSNMHGGRYNLIVTVTDHIDSYTGFVLDYSYLKSAVKNRVIDSLDHRHLNMVDASLSWRSSTELLNILIWERLIDYIPSLEELNLYETENSYCSYSGPSLEEWQALGQEIYPSHFDDPQLGRSNLRRQSGMSSCPVKLTSIDGKKK